MKKFLAAISSVMLVALLALTMAGCSTYGKIEKAFVNDGYTVAENIDKWQDQILKTINENSEEDAKAICTIHVLTKSLNVAVIYEFNSTDEMNKKIEESSTLKGLIKDAQNSDYVNGNCVLFCIGVNYTDMVNTFKKA